MNKELEALEELLEDKAIKDYILYNCLDENFILIRKALQRLEAIDNAKPSEALECLEDMYELVNDLKVVSGAGADAGSFSGKGVEAGVGNVPSKTDFIFSGKGSCSTTVGTKTTFSSFSMA